MGVPTEAGGGRRGGTRAGRREFQLLRGRQLCVAVATPTNEPGDESATSRWAR